MAINSSVLLKHALTVLVKLTLPAFSSPESLTMVRIERQSKPSLRSVDGSELRGMYPHNLDSPVWMRSCTKNVVMAAWFALCASCSWWKRLVSVPGKKRSRHTFMSARKFTLMTNCKHQELGSSSEEAPKPVSREVPRQCGLHF